MTNPVPPVGSSVPGDTETGGRCENFLGAARCVLAADHAGVCLGPKVPYEGDTTPISDEAARALLVARYGEPAEGADFLPASYDRARAEVAAVAPLLVSAEAERLPMPETTAALNRLIQAATVDADDEHRAPVYQDADIVASTLLRLQSLAVSRLAAAKRLGTELAEERERANAAWLSVEGLRAELAAIRDDSDLSDAIGYAYAATKTPSFRRRIKDMLGRHNLVMEV